MKKTFRMVGLALMAVFMGAGLAACSDDDEDEDGDNSGGGGGQVENLSFDAPAYESYSAKYVITSSDAEYESIELTASGNYIIKLNYGSDVYRAASEAPAALSRSAMFKSKLATPTRVGYDDIVYGKYTLKSDGVYELENFGTVTVNKDGEGVASLTIQRNGEAAEVLTAAIQTQHPESTKTSALCRTWKLQTVGVQYVVNGKTEFDKTVSVENLDELFRASSEYWGEEYDESEVEEALEHFPEDVVFTKSGTYMVYYTNQTLAVSTWTWQNEEQGIIRYSWNYDDMYDDDAAGNVTAKFYNNMMYVSESDTDYEDGQSYTETITWGFSEKK